MTFYYFVNTTKNLDDIAGMTNIKNVGILSLFEAIISANGWSHKDVIMAFPENKKGHVIRYANGDFEFKYDEDFEEIIDTEIDEDETEECVNNCTYCGDILRNHIYGNICGKHIPSYALWEDSDANDKDSNYSAFYEELCERKLTMELDLDDNEDDEYNYEDDRYNYEEDRYDYDQGLGYECEGQEESCY